MRSLTDSLILISLYTIFADCRACLPDIHVQTLKGIHFLKPLLKGVVWQKTEFDFVAHVLRTKPLIVEKWFAPKLSVQLQFHKFFWELCEIAVAQVSGDNSSEQKIPQAYGTYHGVDTHMEYPKSNISTSKPLPDCQGQQRQVLVGPAHLGTPGVNISQFFQDQG